MPIGGRTIGNRLLISTLPKTVYALVVVPGVVSALHLHCKVFPGEMSVELDGHEFRLHDRLDFGPETAMVPSTAGIPFRADSSVFEELLEERVGNVADLPHFAVCMESVAIKDMALGKLFQEFFQGPHLDLAQ
ncbi:hypothetical protein HG531_006642 [Fusarium graminearum]|nr:hypothetical protein HG531_006642 [Fusarium graminearum]